MCELVGLGLRPHAETVLVALDVLPQVRAQLDRQLGLPPQLPSLDLTVFAEGIGNVRGTARTAGYLRLVQRHCELELADEVPKSLRAEEHGKKDARVHHALPLQGVAARAIVLRAECGIRQDLVRLPDRLEAGFGILVAGILVWVQLARAYVVRLLDSALRRVGGNAQQVVKLGITHFAVRLPSARVRASAARTARVCALPLRRRAHFCVPLGGESGVVDDHASFVAVGEARFVARHHAVRGPRASLLVPCLAVVRLFDGFGSVHNSATELHTPDHSSSDG
mmetsp:Transcript_13904/g.58019  ORF Transcript_13904/g.58019 Transcript_13904/m.58019 type:complete len:281 (-) Transcript_13904:368-1210(-)